MNSSHSSRHEWFRLLWAVCDGSATPEECVQLQERVLSNPAECQDYLLFQSLSADLAWHSQVVAEDGRPAGTPDLPESAATSDLHDQVDTLDRRAAGKAPAALSPAARSLPRTPLSPTAAELTDPVASVGGTRLGLFARLSRCIPGGEFAVGGLVVLVVAAAFWGLRLAILFPRFGLYEVAGTGAELNVPTTETYFAQDAVATLRESTVVDWIDDSGYDGKTSKIYASHPLSIAAGQVELELESGVTLLIQAPAEWSVDGKNQATLSRGRLVAKVPPPAKGFTLQTQFARIIDLGTEFGVVVEPHRAAEVHVLNGLVMVEAAEKEQPAPSRSLKAGQSLRIDTDGTQTAGEASTGEALAELAAGRDDASPKAAGYDVLFHYRLGEAEKRATGGDVETSQVVGTGTLGSTHPLVRLGTAAAEAHRPAGPGGKQAGKLNVGYLGTEFPELPADNFVLEAIVRPRSKHTQIVIHVGHPSFDGYGLFIGDEKWTRVYGSLATLRGDGAIQLNQWTHLALVRNRGTSQLFVNGQPSGQEVKLEPKAPGTMVMVGRNHRLNETFDGEIREVRLIRLNAFFQTGMFLEKPAASESEGY